jgi:predicted N-formylglutamate amidohydrolase
LTRLGRDGRAPTLLVTCEHGGHEVPAAYRALFASADGELTSHRGWDAGALPLARLLARRWGASLQAATVSRLVVDLNRSAHNPRVFSTWTRGLPRERRDALVVGWHEPHRRRVDEAVAKARAAGAVVLHVGVHTFTPALDGKVRTADLALLYDPARAAERALCAAWVDALAEALPDLAVRRNQPYRGASDGLTTWLRGRHGERYLGIEVEVNQRLLLPGGRFPDRIGRAVADGLWVALGAVAER